MIFAVWLHSCFYFLSCLTMFTYTRHFGALDPFNSTVCEYHLFFLWRLITKQMILKWNNKNKCLSTSIHFMSVLSRYIIFRNIITKEKLVCFPSKKNHSKSSFLQLQFTNVYFGVFFFFVSKNAEKWHRFVFCLAIHPRTFLTPMW